MKPVTKTFLVMVSALVLSLTAVSTGQAAPSSPSTGNVLPALTSNLWSGYLDKTPQIHISLSAATIKVGDTFEAGIWLQVFLGKYKGVEGYQLQIQYDPTLIQPIVTGATGKLETGIFPKALNPIVWSNSVDQKGTITVAESLAPKSPAGLFGGNGKVGVVRFKALKAGEAALTLSESIVIMRNHPGVNIHHSYNIPSVLIGSAAQAGDANTNNPVMNSMDKIVTVGEVPTAANSRSVPEIVQSFKDGNAIKQLSWAQEAIAALSDYGIVSGSSDGSFHPLANITRAEFVQLAVVSLGLDMQQQVAPTFSDVLPDAWYYDVVETAVHYGLINGYTDEAAVGQFRPNNSITRAEIAAILAHSFDSDNTDKGATSKETTFQDVSDNYWAREAILKLYRNQMIQGKDVQHFAPDDSATRAEVSQIVHKLLLLKKS
ncbi:MAG: S-layer homology domain-containing protein [Gorillibacterium sp.]|nr:S-layer homology domain-containing protein [Gorillibacterium sp.]